MSFHQVETLHDPPCLVLLCLEFQLLFWYQWRKSIGNGSWHELLGVNDDILGVHPYDGFEVVSSLALVLALHDVFYVEVSLALTQTLCPFSVYFQPASKPSIVLDAKDVVGVEFLERLDVRLVVVVHVDVVLTVSADIRCLDLHTHQLVFESLRCVAVER